MPIDQQLDAAPHLIGEIADQARVVGCLGSKTLVVAEGFSVDDPIRNGVGKQAEWAKPRKRRCDWHNRNAEPTGQRFDVEEDRRLIVAPDERHRNDRRTRAQSVLDEAHSKLLEPIAVCDRLADSFDAAMAIIDVALNTDPPRLVRAVVDRWAGALPWINIFYARVGQVVGTRENFAKLLDDGQLLLVFPEGIDGMRKTIAHRYRLQKFRVGFIEHALRAGAPIVPVAFIGSDDQSPILFDLKPLARRLGVPVMPITPTFPWFGPLGLLPYPVSYRIIYGEPLRYHERFGPEAADDSRLVRYLANQVRRTVQQLIDRNRQ